MLGWDQGGDIRRTGSWLPGAAGQGPGSETPLGCKGTGLTLHQAYCSQGVLPYPLWVLLP